MRTFHKQVTVEVGRRKAEVDEMIAPLIEELWKARVSTMMSCQNSPPGMAWVLFPTPEDAKEFLDIVAEDEAGPGTLCARMAPGHLAPDEAAPLWEYDVHVEDHGVLYKQHDDGSYEEVPGGIPDLVFEISIRFPHADLPVILARLRAHNAGRGAGAGAGEVARGR